MLILAVETSGPELSAALIEDGKVIAERESDEIGFTHSERLMPMVALLLETAGLSVRDVDVFAASSGPGSFTGVRIGIVCVKGMAYALGKSVIGVPTPDVLAMNAGEGDFQVCAVIDARNGQVYSGIFRFKDGMPELKGAYEAGHVDALALKLAELGVKTALVGSGAVKYRHLLTESSPGLYLPEVPESGAPHASKAGILAYRMALKGQMQKPEELVPFYVRKSQAERNKENPGYHG